MLINYENIININYVAAIKQNECRSFGKINNQLVGKAIKNLFEVNAVN